MSGTPAPRLTSGRAAAIAVAVVAVGVLGAVAYLTLPRLYRRPPEVRIAAPAAIPAPPAPVGRKIKARLFYVSEDGTRLVGVERDVPFAEGSGQAREIVAAQIAPVAEPLVSAVPPGTTLRTLFVTDRGRAYVDLSHEVTTAHSGGTLDELLTVYTIVDALTVNLPGIQSVQILIDGKEAKTLAGHVDLRQPLTKNLSLIEQP
jgi:Sporulation and spore germination